MESKDASEQAVAQSGAESRRYHTQAPGSAYLLPADEQERERLRRQHENDVRVFGNRLITAPVQLKAGDRILDSGAGGGAWMLDAATKVPEGVTIHGIDIEPRLFPKEYPENVSFSVNSITNLPKEWTGAFTYVHQRLLVAGLRKEEWLVALKEIYRVLKPGGWVEFHEALADHEGPEEYMNHTAHYLKHQVFASKGLDIRINDRLPDLLKEAGFVEIASDKKTFPLGKWAGKEAEVMAGGASSGFYRGLKKSVLEQGGFGRVSTEAEFDAVMDDLAGWWDTGSRIYFGYHAHTAQKPE